ncbi:hypothetical protein GNI_089150 [Gregarina niphandrodes]|uniref:Uncharacterized protein n=1 Tax=Gregarina niphandrodes TaxID=110365 RepID=A0A023B5Z2_GRENI|nr:hypothetical protein GNI_089150 [Gregarina niphandrodes]EZG61415.1 hypothetical protein GNI_089150 [Gregarina niphandrodes]|eukprot:XP_011130775.1 hypothetical protein GNI_089150 [Gregarina niphandrodes]
MKALISVRLDDGGAGIVLVSGVCRSDFECMTDTEDGNILHQSLAKGPPEWKSGSGKSRTSSVPKGCIDNEEENLTSLWRKPWFVTSIGAAAGATALSGFLSWWCPVGAEAAPTADGSAIKSYSSASEIRRYYQTLSTNCDKGSSVFDWIMKCMPDPLPRPEPSIDDINSLISGHELATLRLPWVASNKMRHGGKMEASMRNATVDGWKEFDWSFCDKPGGRILCTDHTDHYYGAPFKFDFPTVWEAVVHIADPTQCSFQYHSSDEQKRLAAIRRGVAGGKWAGIDVDNASEDMLYQLGLKVLSLSTVTGSVTENCIEARVGHYKFDEEGPCYTTEFGVSVRDMALYNTAMTRGYDASQIDWQCSLFEDEEDAKQKLEEFWRTEVTGWMPEERG